MGSTKVKGVVIASKDFKEKDRLITLYTLEQGKMSCMMRGVRGEKAKLKAAKEVFSFGEYIIENTKGMNIITQVEVIDSFFELTRDLDKFYEGCALVDIVGKISSEESDPRLFIELVKCLKTLCYENVHKLYVLDKFLIRVFESLGYSFITDKCSSCKAKLTGKKYFNLDIGEFVCAACKNDTCVLVSDACFGALKLLSSTDYDRLSSIKLGGDGEKECLRLLEKNFEWRMGKRFISVPLD